MKLDFPSDAEARLVLEGRIEMPFLHQNRDDLKQAINQLADVKILHVDFSQLEAFDTGGAWLLVEMRKRLEARGVEVEYLGLQGHRQAFFETVERNMPALDQERHTRDFWDDMETLGRRVVTSYLSVVEAVNFFGLALIRMVTSVLWPKSLRITPTVHHVQETGISAVPIVMLMNFLIGIVLAFQGANQLRAFGAEIYAVDLIAISILRELGVLLTAILVAGRSGSAFTAAIGSMKLNEEVDAMRTLGLDPMETLVVPRVFALLIALPGLTLIADLSGLFGGMLMCWMTLDISPSMFLVRLQENTGIWNPLIGLIKAPVFALVIALVGCYQGLRVAGGADSLGQLTTRSVVIGIFAVIIVDAMFSIFFSELGI